MAKEQRLKLAEPLSLMLFGLCVCLIIAHRNFLWKELLLSFEQIPVIHFLIKNQENKHNEINYK